MVWANYGTPQEACGLAIRHPVTVRPPREPALDHFDMVL
jgi:hypothetical protein